MPDGSRRKRRNTGPRIKQQWYAWYRSYRFSVRYGVAKHGQIFAVSYRYRVAIDQFGRGVV